MDEGRGKEGWGKEKEGGNRRGRGMTVLTYLWSLQTVLLGVVQEGRHVVVQLCLQTVDQEPESMHSVLMSA